MKGWHVLAAALTAFYAYYLWPAADQPDVYYVAGGVLVITLALRLWPFARSWADHLACAVCLVEASQQSLCGLVMWGQLATGEDLCRRAVGPDVYALAASLVVSASIAWGVKTWRR